MVLQKSYRLEVFDGNDGGSASLNEALLLYSSNTSTLMATKPDDIRAWSQVYNEKYSDALLLFGFYERDVIIWFAECLYIKDCKVLLIDHIAIELGHRDKGSFHVFCDFIEDYMNERNFECVFAVAEVQNNDDAYEGDAGPKYLMRLLGFRGFKVLDIEYSSPNVNSDEPFAHAKSNFMIYSRTKEKIIRTQVALNIVRKIYDAYIRWHKPISKNNFTEYKRHVDGLYGEFKNRVDGVDVLRLIPPAAQAFGELDGNARNDGSGAVASSSLFDGVIVIVPFMLMFVFSAFVSYMLNANVFEIAVLEIVIAAIYLAIVAIRYKSAIAPLSIIGKMLRDMLSRWPRH